MVVAASVFSPGAFIDTFNYWHIVIIPIMSEYMHECDSARAESGMGDGKVRKTNVAGRK